MARAKNEEIVKKFLASKVFDFAISQLLENLSPKMAPASRVPPMASLASS
jgi:hypothetical protein